MRLRALLAGLAAAGVACSGGGGAAEGAAATLETYALVAGDLGPGTTLRMAPGGDRLEGATLDLCGATFPSEGQRVARRYVLVGGEGATIDGNENVAYATEAAAAAALEEVRAAVAACDPGRLTPGPVAGLPALRSDLRATATGHALDSVAVAGRVTFENGTEVGVAVAYVRRGCFVGVVYGRELGPVLDGARTVGDRLAGLRAGAVTCRLGPG